MTPRGRISRSSAFTFAGLAVLALALGASWLHAGGLVSDPVLAALLHAVGYRVSDRMWLPGHVARGKPMVERVPLQRAGSAGAFPPIKFLGAEGDLEADGSF